MEYYFDELDPVRFQRLIHALLQHVYGDALKTGPLRGKDDGLDGEAIVTEDMVTRGRNIRPGHHKFQVKHHTMRDTDTTAARQTVVREFKRDAEKHALAGTDKPTFFHLFTNVSSSAEALRSDRKAAEEMIPGVEGRIWWQSDVIAMLDRTPTVWPSFPELFAGRVVPFFGAITSASSDGAAATLRAALARRYDLDRQVKFRQIDLERELTRLFIDPELSLGERQHYDALEFLMAEAGARLLVEGGPGQGKSTVTQMLAQIYRHELLGKRDMQPESRWRWPEKLRVPLRIELRQFADAGKSLEEYLVQTIVHDAGGGTFRVDDLRRLFAESPLLLVLDGLDEIGSDTLRDRAVEETLATLSRIQAVPQADVTVVVTSRPPAIAGRRPQFESKGFVRVVVLPLSETRIDRYVERWCDVQLPEERERQEVLSTFRARRRDPHVAALAGNPMQLAVLLHLIRMKGAAFPTRRAELYRDYFERVIDRDVEKNVDAAKHRDLITRLHEFLAFEIHARVESQECDGTLTRRELVRLVNDWLRDEAGTSIDATTLFKLGEERLGLIVCPRGEGASAVYGFEIQPIREYFAAAYLNESVTGDAHEIFVELLRRPFWREVAVFLAGLRRPNERADLIERARALDNDPVNGWRQHGRGFVSQLLRDGVFTQPQYLYEQAFDLVADSLDGERVPFGVAPEWVYLMGLAATIPTSALPRRAASLLRKLDRPDLEILRQLLQLAPETWDGEKTLLAAGKEDPAVVPRLRWDPALADRFSDSIRPDLWAAALREAWAREIWRSGAYVNEGIVNRGLPHALHPLLLEQFASYPAIPFGWPWRIESQNLIWLFAEIEALASQVPTDFGISDADLAQFLQAHLRRVRQARKHGLSPDLAEPLHELLRSSGTFLVHRSTIAADEFLKTLNVCLQEPGLVSLVAARHAASVVLLDGYGGQLLRPRIFGTDLSRFYSKGSDLLERLYDGDQVTRFRALHLEIAPTRMRLSSTRADEVSDQLRECAMHQREPPFEFMPRLWFKAGDCVRMTFKLTVRACQALFEMIGPHGIWDDHEWLEPSEGARLMEVLGETRSDRVRQTVLAMMMMVPPETPLPVGTLTRAMQADRAGWFADRVFWPHVVVHRLELAEAVKRQPEAYAYGYRWRAARVLAVEASPNPIPPLLELRDSLGLHAGPRR